MTKSDVRDLIRGICWDSLSDSQLKALVAMYPREKSDLGYLDVQEMHWRGAVELLMLSYDISPEMKNRLLAILEEGAITE